MIASAMLRECHQYHLQAKGRVMSQFHFDYHRMIVGYHGCDRELIKKVILDGEPLCASANPWDWLGEGIYFWEYGPQRAFEFAQEQQGRGKLENPAVLGAYIHLGRCFDLADTRNTRDLAEAHTNWASVVASQGLSLPQNKKGRGGGDDLLLRFQDCAVINWHLRRMDQRYESGYYYRTVRGVFIEGDPIYEGAGIYEKTHVQIAIRDSACIMGYFLPHSLSEEDEQHE